MLFKGFYRQLKDNRITKIIINYVVNPAFWLMTGKRIVFSFVGCSFCVVIFVSPRIMKKI